MFILNLSKSAEWRISLFTELFRRIGDPRQVLWSPMQDEQNPRKVQGFGLSNFPEAEKSVTSDRVEAKFLAA